MTDKFLMKYDELATMMVDQIPEKQFKSKTSTFFDPSMGRGQIIAKIEQKLKDYGHSISNISKRVYGYEVGKFEMIVAVKDKGLVGNYEYGDNVFEVEKKFDNVITNPPYDGTIQLHQQFANMAIETWCKPNGNVVCIAPATPYLNQKVSDSQKKKRKHEAKMIENVLKYKTNVQIVDPSIFQGAEVANDLAITHVNKVDNTSNKLNSIIYKDGSEYKNVDVADVSMTGIDPDVFSKIKNKYETYVNKHGSLEDVIYLKDKVPASKLAGIPKIRGHMGNIDFYTYMPVNVKDSEYYTTNISQKHDFGVKVQNNKQLPNVYSYLTTYVARFGLALTKISLTHHRKESRRVPLVDFNKKWTDEVLMKELGLTQKEMKLMIKVVGDYHGKYYAG